MEQASSLIAGIDCDINDIIDIKPNFDSIQTALQKDDRHDFVRLVNRLSLKRIQDIHIFSYDAPNCVAAILAGETGEIFNTRYFLDEEARNLPLHQAARFTTPRVAELLLAHGFKADSRADFDSHQISLKDALPLNVALETYRYLLDCVQERRSAISIIASCCGCLSKETQTIRVLARNTKEIKHEFFKYLKQGKLVEVGALLAVASDCILSSSTAENGIGFKNIAEMHQFLSAELSSLSVNASHTQSQGENQFWEMEETLRLLNIFDRIGNKLIAHLVIGHRLVSDTILGVASVIEDAGFDVKVEDVYDVRPRLRGPPSSFRLNVLKRGVYDESTTKGSMTKVVTNRLKEGHPVDKSVALPREASVLPSLTVGGSATKHCWPLSSRNVEILGKGIRHLRYL